MMQKVNTVFVGKKVNAAGTTLAVGDIVAINAATGAVIATANIATAEAIQLGYVRGIGATDANANIVKTQVIGKNNVDNITADGECAYVAKTEAAASIDFTGVTPVAGNRYVIRVIYKDLYEHPGQFTHSYEVIATAADTIDTIGDKFAARINAHKGARATATYTAGTDVLLISAKVIDGFGTAGKEAITPYSQVQMQVVAYYTNGTDITGAQNAIPGITISNAVVSKPGKGNPFIVRDREQAALSYKGITYRTEFPVIKPELNVDLSKTYDTLVVEYTRDYQSPDNQYVKSTGLAAEVYVEAGQGAEALRDILQPWAARVGAQGPAGA